MKKLPHPLDRSASGRLLETLGTIFMFLIGLTNDAFSYILTKVDFNSFPVCAQISRVSLGETTGEIYIQRASNK
jgi:hypothetical protein